MVRIHCKKMDKNSNKIKEYSKKVGNQRREKCEKIVKEKINKREVDYDTAQLILNLFGKSKFSWKSQYFEDFDSNPCRFRGKELPENGRECVMMGMQLGTLRSNVLHNLKGMAITDENKKSIDELVWSLLWYQWKEARMIYDFTKNESSLD